MAEIVGVVASAAGLLSLSIQIVDTTRKLKARFAAIKGLPETIDKIDRNLEFLRIFLDRAEEPSSHPTNKSTDTRYQVLLNTCWADYTVIRDVLKRLERRLEKMMAAKASSLLRPPVRGSGAIVTEVQNLDQLERRAHEHITLAMLALLDNKITASMSQAPPIQPNAVQGTPPTNHGHLPTDEIVRRPVLRNPKISYCGVRHCHCSCHATKTFWAFRYTPLGAVLRACDRESCNARRYRFSIQIQLSRLGIPLSVLVGGEFITGLAGMSIKPVFGCVQQVVKATSMGFRTLVRLEHGDIDRQEAKDILRQLYRSDRTFKTHVNPQGRTYLQELVRGGPWGQYGHQLGLQLELLALFVDEFQLKSGIDTLEFIIEIAGWGCESAHWAIADTLVHLGQSFEDLDDPLFIAWPEPCLPRSAPFEMYGEPNLEAHDPFYIDFIARIVDLNEYFGGTHPLHQAVYRRNGMLVREWVIRLGRKIDTVSNFLGQTPIHGALAPESSDILNLLLGQAPALINVADKWGFTPLMYAMALGYNQAASLLIKNGASLTSRSNWKHLDFIGCAFQWDQEDLIWGLLQDINRENDYVWAALADQTNAVVNSLSTPRTERWMDRFWATLFAGSRANMVFGDTRSTLGHLARTPKTAQRLADAGFIHYNHRNGSGKHCLFPAVGSLNSELVRVLLMAGTLTDIQDTKGKTCLHKVVKKIGRVQDPKLAKALAVFDIARLLLSQPGTRSLAGVTDNCHCPCSENGHLAPDQLSAELQDSIMFDATSPLWVIEYLSTLEDFGLEEETRQGILAQLRLCKFSKLGIPHRCRCFGRGEEEDRLWDLTWIEDEKKIEKLEAEMTELQQLPLSNLRECFVSRMRESYEMLREQRVTEAEEQEKRSRARQAKENSNIKPLPNLVVDEDNDQIYTQLDLLFQHRELFEGFCGAIEDRQADPLKIVYNYLDYVIVLGKREEIYGNEDQIEAILCRRLEWIGVFLESMELPEFSEVCKGWRKGVNERLALATQAV